MKIRISIIFVSLFFLHLIILLLTEFIDWPEPLLYPWLMSNGFNLYKDLLIPYQPLSLQILTIFYKLFGFNIQNLRIIHLSLVVLTDFVLILVLIKTTRSILSSIFGLLLYILWQPTIEGNGLWFDHFLLPFSLLAYYFTLEAIKKKNRISILLASSFLGLLFLTKQTSITLVGLLIFPVVDGLFLKSKYKSDIIFPIFFIALLLPFLQLLYFYVNDTGENFLFWAYKFGLGLKNDPNYLIAPNIVGDLPLIQLISIVLILLTYFTTKRIYIVAYTGIWLFSSYLMMFPRWTLTHFSVGLVFTCLLISQALSLFYKKHHYKAFIFFASIIFILSLKVQHTYLVNHLFKENRFYNSVSINLIKSIKDEISGERYYHFGNTEYLYAYMHEIPVIKPYVQLFPWNTQLADMQEKQIKEIINNDITYIIYSPYHPDNLYYRGRRPELLYSFLESNYYMKSKIFPSTWIYAKRVVDKYSN